MSHFASLRALRPALAGGQGHWGRQLMAVLAIALGTALGVAVNLINGAAVDEFSAAANQFGGSADLAISAGRDGFAESLFAKLATLPGIAVASPVVDGALPVLCQPAAVPAAPAAPAVAAAPPAAAASAAPAASSGAPREAQATRILGVDPFRAVRIDPHILPAGDLVARLLEPGQVLLSSGAAQALACKAGDTLDLLGGGPPRRVQVAAVLPDAGSARSFLLMDIAYAQEALSQLGRLQRIDLRLRDGSSLPQLKATLAQLLPAGVQAGPPEDSGTRTATLSRAYRANLTVLALIALFTGAFLVFTTQTLAVARRRARIGLLRALGVERRQILLGIASEGLQVGLAGAIAGVLLGTFAAAWALAHFGGDLGAGYFSGTHPAFHADLGVDLVFLLLGTGCAVAGSLLPAWQAAGADPALALRPGMPVQSRRRGRNWLGAAMLVIGTVLCFTPPIFGLPLGGYVAIALLLVGLLALLPQLTAFTLGTLPTPAGALAELALAGLRSRSREAALSLATIVVAVSLVAAMLVMIGSFRTSLASWLDQVLPADLYMRGKGAVPGLLLPATRQELAALPGVAGVDALRTRSLLLRPDLPAVALIARDVDLLWAHQGMAVLTGARPGYEPRPQCDLPCVWASEAMVDLYGVQLGQRLRIPLDGHWLDVRVTGIWRDYARQFGALLIDRQDYERLTGDALADDASIYLKPGYTPQAVLSRMPPSLGSEGRFELAEPRAIKSLSLTIFDRSFTVTYALEAVALVIGLLGISAGFGAQVLARQREFAVLVHLGATRRQVLGLVTREGALISTIGVGLGLLSGSVIGLILIRVINRQSFHWSMELHMPWLALAALGTLMLLAATLTALISAREGTGQAALLAIREET